MQGARANRIKRIILDIVPLLILALCVVLDQVSKKYFTDLYFEKGDTTVIENFFYLTYTVNTGAAWSFLADVSWGQLFFKILTSIALVFFSLFYVYAIKRRHVWLKFSLAFMIGGTIGNFIDRLVMNGVTDFISFIFGNYRFPVFNLADTFLTVGVIMLMVHFCFFDENAIFKKNDGNKELSNN